MADSGTGLLADNSDIAKILSGKPDWSDILGNMAVTFAKYGQSSSRPTSLLGAIGEATGGASLNRDKIAKEQLQQLQLAQQVQALRQKFQLTQKYAPILEKMLQKEMGGVAGPSTAGPSTAGPTTAVPGTAAPETPGGAPAVPGGAPPDTLPISAMPEFNINPGRAGRAFPAPPGAAPAAAPTASPPPDATAGYGGGDVDSQLGILDMLSGAQGGAGGTQQLLAALQGGPAAGNTPARFRDDDSRYAAMVAPAADRTGLSGSSGDPLSLIAKYESGGRNVRQGVVPASESSASGPWQMLDSTFHEAANKAGIDVSQYKSAIDAPIPVQKAVAQALYNQQGYRPWAPYNPRLAAAIGARGTGGGGEGVTGGAADLVGATAAKPAIPPALSGLLTLAMGGSGGGDDPLAGLLAAGAGGGDDGGSLPGDLISGLGRPRGAVDAADLRAGPVEAPAERPTASGASLAAYATGNARPGGPSSVEGLNPGFANAISTMVADMPPEIRQKFQIISGHRDAARQMEVNPSAPNSRHIPGLAADLGNDPAVLNWIRENGSRYDVGFPLPGAKEANHLEFLPGGLRTGGAATRLPRAVTEGVGDLPDVRSNLLGPGAAGDSLPPALRGLLALATDGGVNDDALALSGGSTNPYEQGMRGVTAEGAGGGDTAGGPVTGLRAPSGALPGMPSSAAETRPFAAAPGAAPSATPTAPGAPPGALPSMPGIPEVPGLDPGTPRRLALLDAMAKLAGLDMPFKELMEVYYKDPKYLMQAAGAKAAGELPSQIQLAAIKAGYDLSNNKEIERLKSDLAMLKDGIVTEAGVQKLAPGRLELEGQRARQESDIKERAKALQESTEINVPVRDPLTGFMTNNKFSVTREEAGNYAQGKGIPRLGIPATGGGGAAPTGAPGATGTGPIGGAPVAQPGSEKMADEATKGFASAQAAEDAANKHTQVLGQLAEAMQGFKPGATAEARYSGLRVLRDLGFIKGEEVPSMETFRRASSYLQFAAAPRGQGSFSNLEREMLAPAIPRMVDSEEGLIQAINMARRLDDYDRRVAGIWRESADRTGVPNYLEARKRIAALGPPLSPGEMGALQDLKEGKKPAASSEGNTELPAGAKKVGTYKGNPVYELPDGSRKVLQ